MKEQILIQLLMLILKIMTKLTNFCQKSGTKDMINHLNLDQEIQRVSLKTYYYLTIFGMYPIKNTFLNKLLRLDLCYY